jgi:TonB family protein
VVNTEGKCERVDVLQASPIPKLDETAVKHALRVWKFSPATEDGKPVVSNYDLKITWRVLD